MVRMTACVCSSVLILVLFGFGTQPTTTTVVRVAAITQSWAKENRTLAHVLDMLSKAAEQRSQIVCLPEECIPTDGGAQAAAAVKAISEAAQKHRMYIAANLKERDGAKLYSTSYLIGPDGKAVGKYRKTHRLPDEQIALGDDLPVFDTRYGKIGLMIGSEHYWPEVPLVMALKGADLILWSSGVEPVPQGYPLDFKVRARAVDNHVTLVCAGYAGDLPYLCSNYPEFTGQPLGRSYVVDQSGTIIADTGIRNGVAVAQTDLRQGNNLFHLVFQEDRKLFRYLVDPQLPPTVSKPSKRKIRVAIAQVSSKNGPNPDPGSIFIKTLEDAAGRGSDLVVMSEFGFKTDTDVARKTFALISEIARKDRTYVVIGGLNDIGPHWDKPTSWTYIWDRGGAVIGKYRISQYGLSRELPVFKTDFGVMGVALCGDIYSQEIFRSLALQGADIIVVPSQSWGPSGQHHLWLNGTRAIDNCVHMITVHFPFSDFSQRSFVIDPFGYVLAASRYMSEGVATADIDLDLEPPWFTRTSEPGLRGKTGYLAGYYPEFKVDKKGGFRSVLFAQRRPELYRPIVDLTLSHRGIPEAIWEKMKNPPAK